MTMAFDAVSSANSGGFTVSPFTWTHTPVGTPRSIRVWIIQSGIGALNAGACAYGGVPMTKVAEVAHASGEQGVVYCFHLGTGIPTGPQTVSYTHTVSPHKFGVAISDTADADTEVVDSDNTINADSQANPSVTLQLTGRNCMVGIGFFSGDLNITGITPLAGWTDRGEYDYGANTAAVYTYDTYGSADVSAGWTQAADDAVAIALAVAEVGGAPPQSYNIDDVLYL